jgi:hypothetical protein
VKLPKKNTRTTKQIPIVDMLRALSPEQRKNILHKMDIVFMRLMIKARTKAISKPRIMWAAGLLYLLDGVCRTIKM